MRRLLRIILTTVVLSAIIVGGVVFFQYQQATSVVTPVSEVTDSIEVQQGNLSLTVSATGSITPIREVPLVFEYSAPVAEIRVQEGDVIKQGDVLALLDAPDLMNAFRNAELSLASQQNSYLALTTPARDVDIAVAEAALQAAQAQTNAAFSASDPNQAEIARLQADLARNQLWQAQLQRDYGPAAAAQAASQAAALGFSVQVPDADASGNITPLIQQAENDVALADVNLTGAINSGPDVAGLASANAAIVNAQIQLDRLLNGATDYQLSVAEVQLKLAQLALEQAQAALDRSILIAPFDGVIAKNYLVVGELPPQGAAFTLIDNSTYYVDVAVDETEIVDIKPGQIVNLRLDALPDAVVSGVVSRVAITPIQVGQLVTYTVRITVDPTTASIRTGMTATATIVITELTDVLIVPNRFIRIDRSTQQAFVTIDDGGTYRDVPVRLGVRNEVESQVLSGVEAGQRIVLIPRGSFIPAGGPPQN